MSSSTLVIKKFKESYQVCGGMSGISCAIRCFVLLLLKTRFFSNKISASSRSVSELFKASDAI
jgi:hypothetical protein